MPHPDIWLCVRPEGLRCTSGDFFIDPVVPVARAVITHAPANQARPGHQAVLATKDTLAIMRVRMGAGRAEDSQQAVIPGEVLRIGGMCACERSRRGMCWQRAGGDGVSG